MRPPVLVDTGPLVALLNRREKLHQRVTAVLGQLPSPLLTAEPVLVEAMFLLRTVPGGSRAVLSMLRDGFIRVPFAIAPEASDLDAKNKRKNPGNREPNLVTEARVGGAEVGSTRVSVAVFCRGEWAQECCGHTGRATAKSARSERWPSHRERQLRRCGGWRQHPRGQGDAELGEAGFGVLAGGMEAPDGAPSATGATQDVGAEGALVKLGPVEAGPLWFRRG